MGMLYVVAGIPGSGKSTWIEQHMKPFDRHISRDDIRFTLVKEDEEYFSKEKLVFHKFIEEIDFALAENIGDVFADATHLNPASRNKLLRNIKIKPDDISCIWIKTPLQIAIKRNENRKGTRAYVPKDVIYDMNNRFIKPEFYEGFSKIYIIEPNQPIQIIEEG